MFRRKFEFSGKDIRTFLLAARCKIILEEEKKRTRYFQSEGFVP